MTNVITVVGTRPEAIKLAPVIHEFERDCDTFRSTIVVTGQHREMLDPMLALFNIEPDHDLNLMKRGQSLFDITRGVMDGLRPIIEEVQPDWVVVQGDTTSAMASSLAAFYCKTRVAHVEAGLRTFDKYSPYPEEINRRIAGVLADKHFAPTPWARANLLREGVPASHVHLTGNTVIDALRHVRELDFPVQGSDLHDVPTDRGLVLVTAHRSENLGRGMEEIALGIRDVALRHPDINFLYPMHMNPKARASAVRHLLDLDNVMLKEPFGYQEMVWVLHRACLVITDSGGLQEEAAGAGVPVLVLRDTTERPEGIRAGIAKLVEPRRESIAAVGDRLLSGGEEYDAMRSADCPYGDGRAALRIADVLAERPTIETLEDHIYERPLPEHPLDTLLREATEGLPQRYADQVVARARRRARDLPTYSNA